MLPNAQKTRSSSRTGDTGNRGKPGKGRRGALGAVILTTMITIPFLTVPQVSAGTPTPETVTVDVSPQPLKGTRKVFVPYVGVMSAGKAQSDRVQAKIDRLEDGVMTAADDGADELLSAWSDRVYAERRTRLADVEQAQAEQERLQAAERRAVRAEDQASDADARADLAEERLARLEKRLAELEKTVETSGRTEPSPPSEQPVPAVSDSPK